MFPLNLHAVHFSVLAPTRGWGWILDFRCLCTAKLRKSGEWFSLQPCHRHDEELRRTAGVLAAWAMG